MYGSVAMKTSTLLLIAFINNVGASVATPEEPSFRLVRGRYIENLTSIRSIDATYDLSWSSYRGDKYSARDKYTNIHVHMARDGARRMMDVILSDSQGKRKIECWGGYNGTRFAGWHQVLETDGNNGFPPGGMIGSKVPDALALYHSLDQLIGIGNEGFHGVEDLIKALPEANVIMEQVSGVPAIRIDLGEHPRRRGLHENAFRTTVWFDPNESYFPRRIKTDYLPTNEKNQGVYREIVIDEFKRLTDSSGKMYSIPTQAHIHSQQSGFKFQLIEAQVNTRVDSKLFEPVFPRGSRITEETADGKYATLHIGGREAVHEMVAKYQIKPEDIVPPIVHDLKKTDASPKPDNSLHIFFYFVSSIMAAAAFCAYLIRRRFR